MLIDRLLTTCLVCLAVLANPIRAADALPPLVIGQVVSLSENGGDIGQGLRDGQALYLRAVNDQGGVNGRLLQLVTRDDRYRPELTITQTTALLRESNPIALAGYRGTANTLELMASGLLERNGIALVGVFSGAVEIRAAPNIFHLRPTLRDEIKALARTTMDLGQTRVAVLYQDDAYGQSGLRELEAIAVPYGLDLTARVRYDKRPGLGADSVRMAAQQVLAAAPQAVIMIAVGDPACSFMQQLRNGGYDSSIYSLSFANPQRTVELLGKERARGIAFAQAFPALDSQGSPLIRDYQALRARYTPNLPASYFSLEGFINAKVLVEAIRRAGPEPTRAKVLAALNTFGNYDLGKFIVSLSADDRQGSRFVDLTVLDRDGRLVH